MYMLSTQFSPENSGLVDYGKERRDGHKSFPGLEESVVLSPSRASWVL
jgi:hypothetical protein